MKLRANADAHAQSAVGECVVAAEPELDDLVRRFEHRVPYFTSRVQRRFMMGNRWRDDLVSAGYWGLFKALKNRREDAHERELSAYVSRRIEGAVIDEARTCLSRSARADTVAGMRLHGLDDASDSDDGSGFHAGLRWVPTMNEAQGPEALAASRQRLSAIEDAFSGLEPAQRSVMRAYMEGASLSEIARSEGVSAGTMQVRFQKLTRRLRARAPMLRRILLDCEHV